MNTYQTTSSTTADEFLAQCYAIFHEMYPNTVYDDDEAPTEVLVKNSTGNNVFRIYIDSTSVKLKMINGGVEYASTTFTINSSNQRVSYNSKCVFFMSPTTQGAGGGSTTGVFKCGDRCWLFTATNGNTSSSHDVSYNFFVAGTSNSGYNGVKNKCRALGSSGYQYGFPGGVPGGMLDINTYLGNDAGLFSTLPPLIFNNTDDSEGGFKIIVGGSSTNPDNPNNYTMPANYTANGKRYFACFGLLVEDPAE